MTKKGGQAAEKETTLEAIQHRREDALPQASEVWDANLYRKISWRLMPLLFLCYLINYLDRTNVGYAQLQMRDALQFGDMVFGLGAAAFFLGFALFEIPSNVLLARVGVRITLLRIMVLWGVASAATMFVTTPTQFYAVRFLVGVFEAGFAPGVLYYLTLWYPPQQRARANALFFMGFGIAPIVAGPFAGSVMTWLHGVRGLDGWQWLFLLEGIPAVLLGVVAWMWLDDSPEEASWLTKAERQRVKSNLHIGADEVTNATKWTDALRNGQTWGLALVSFLVVLGIYALAFWQPTLLKGLGLSLLQVGMAAVPPALAGIASSIWFGGRSDKKRERRGHFAVAAIVGAIGLIATTSLPSSVASAVLGLSVASAGISAAFTILWACPGEVLPKRSLPVGIAFISTAAGFSGVVGPPVVAALKTATGGFSASLYLLAGALVLAALLLNVVLVSKRHPNP